MNERHIPYGRQWIDESDLAALAEAARADFITQGPRVDAFERALAEAVGAPYAVAVSSGTAALHLASLAAGVQPGDLAIAPAMSFIASMNGAVYCGARPAFADVDAQTHNVTADSVAAAIARAGRPRLVVAVDFAGLPAPMPAIARVAREVGAVVIEDGCHALGAAYRDPDDARRWHPVGSCAHADMTVFSFHPVKHITTGEGGAITTRSEPLYRSLRRLRTHGVERDPERLRAPESERGPWYTEMQELGFNYRITDLQAALGSSQLRRLGAFVERRRQIAARYRAALSQLAGVVLPVEPDGVRHAYHLFPIWVDEARLGRSRRAIFEQLRAEGLGVQVHYLPIHLQPYYRDRFGTEPGLCPEAERFYRGEISIPMFPAMSDADVDRVIEVVSAAVAGRRGPTP